MANSPEIDSFLTESLGIPPNFFITLPRNDDWSFIIKLHAVIESTLIHLLTSRFQDERLRGVFVEMDNNDIKRGRLAFVRALDLLPSHSRTFIVNLGTLRNLVAHSIRHVGFEINSDLNKDVKKNLRDSMLKMHGDTISIRKPQSTQPTEVKSSQYIDDDFKLAILRGVISILTLVLDADLARKGIIGQSHQIDYRLIP